MAQTLSPFSTIPSEAPENPDRRYPHLVVRIMSAVYQREKIDIRTGEPKVGISHHGCYVQHPGPLTPDGRLTDPCRALLIEGVGDAVRRTGFRMCLVWAPHSCTFVERDSVNDSGEPPSGGLAFPAKLAFDQRVTVTPSGEYQPAGTPD